ncbi:hypothetical protein NEOLEDRAFT_797601 [Neolentinus lepideus HHB14362 ss-1]|uniref:Uncharacterized protein n=1 Tax=Neolentinus lepideus HHB14362 ss-1 TaxID=1314782 RepID=A0A165PH94_9AGAM|nr:hypothetical protein NEOLEDRAFT_797601 [Neolentinus lepideus HHB14362 ss-1]
MSIILPAYHSLHCAEAGRARPASAYGISSLRSHRHKLLCPRRSRWHSSKRSKSLSLLLKSSISLYRAIFLLIVCLSSQTCCVSVRSSRYCPLLAFAQRFHLISCAAYVSRRLLSIYR